MSEPVEVKVVQEKKKKGMLSRVSDWVHRRQTPSLQESERFSRLGYLKYPQRAQMELRVFSLAEILEEIEEELDAIKDTTLTGEELQAYAFRHIKKLFRAFMTVGSPYFRGLDNRELAKKAVAFFELETMVGHLPSFYPDLKLCTEALINLSWQAIDVTPETPVLFETRTTIQPTRDQRINIDEMQEY